MYSLGAKSCIRASNGKFPTRKSIIARSEVVVAPHNSTTRIFPLLSKDSIPLADLHVEKIIERHSQNNILAREDSCKRPQFFHSMFLEEAYEKCRNICAEYAKTFYLGPFPSFISLDLSNICMIS